jgi:hypothetical protein
LKPRSLRSNQFLLLGRNLWLSKRPLLPLLLQQEALFRQKRLRKECQHKNQHQIFKQFFQVLRHQVRLEEES